MKRSRLGKYLSSTSSAAISLLVVGSILVSLTSVTFHYKSADLAPKQQQRENEEQSFGPPIAATDRLSRWKNATSPALHASNAERIDASEPPTGARAANHAVPGNDRSNNTEDSSSSVSPATSGADTPGREPSRTKAEEAVAPTETNGCLGHLNSRSWLESERLGNQNISDSRSIDNHYVMSSILGIPSLLSGDETHSRSILRQTLCAESSRFLNLRFSASQGAGIGNDHGPFGPGSEADPFSYNNRTVRALSLRLMYLSVHVHQHRHAIEEAGHRAKHPEACERDMASNRVGPFDFECPAARFLVVPLKHSGLGGQARLVAAPALMAGIATDRVVVFANGTPVGPRFLRERWDLASCPRGDKQCFFLPDTPCVPTLRELENAAVLGKPERRALFKTGELPENFRNDRVVVMNMIDRPSREPANFRGRLSDTARRFLIDPLAERNPDDPRLRLLYEAADHILEEDEAIGDSFFYFGRNFRAQHAMVFFALRPRLEYAERIDAVLEAALGVNHRTDLALGLPIRASDKCIDESECPSFETYVSLLQTVWETNAQKLADDRNRTTLGSSDQIQATTAAGPPNPHTDIILTTESPEVLKAQKEFEEQTASGNHGHLSFPYRFVTNPFDVLPNTGNPQKLALAGYKHNREEVILSSLASLKMQFYAKYTVGNCCSNHHLLLFDYLVEGCGAGDLDHVPTCMQDHDDPRFRICCGWTKTEECLAKRSEREALKTQKAGINKTAADLFPSP